MKLQIRDQRNGNWYWISRNIYEQYTTKIGVIGLALYNAYASHAYDSQKVYPSQDFIIKRLGITKPTLIKYNKILVKYNLIKIDRKEGQSNRITLLKVRNLPVKLVKHGGKRALTVVVKQLNPNNKHKNNTKTTVRAKASDGLLSSKPPKKSFELKCSIKLADALKTKRKIMSPVNIKNWTSSIKKLLSHGRASKKEFKQVLLWYIKNIGKKYLTKAYSAKTFCDMFAQIRDAMEQDIKKAAKGDKPTKYKIKRRKTKK